ncbi:hypothetical protein FE257_006749 [Aspergillus nanangensis]|uniref:Carboxymuconolactone decarboxylase-like domain-containing protein n=1 Tax=Aspergillus nanangensis TaxID=2582783 RepID=A0AAD4GTY4_ASPNN|nr:hypothetical protein FE257_006749 [Aspergillus nanangensis]
MTKWDENEFMSEWDRKYVSTNVKPGSPLYSTELLLGLHRELLTSQPQLKDVASAIIATACCAVGRADVVGRIFDDLTANSDPAESQQIFLRLREALTIVFPYVGMPTCIPACYGMIGVIQRKGEAYASTRVLRSATITEEDARMGQELRSRVYKGVGNSEIFGLMDRYFTDLFTTSTVVTWGYLIAKANEGVFEPNESHLIVASTIIALGATRQSKSHIKATLGLGNSVECVNAVIRAVSEIAYWAGRPIDVLNVDSIASS